MTPISSVIQVSPNTRIVTLNPDDWEAYGRAAQKADPAYKYVTAGWQLYVFRGARPLALEVEGTYVCFMADYLGKKPRPGGWGPYINNNMVYTLPQYRGRGYVSTLSDLFELEALRCGWQRSVSLAAGYPGFLYQLKSKRTFWGLTDNGELRCDTPLDPKQPQPSGVPYCAQDLADAHPLSAKELVEIIHSSNKYGRQPRKVVQEALERHPLAYNPAAFKPRRTLLDNRR